MYAKRDNLRADKAILVSNVPLGSSALKMAADRGIDIRTLSEIDKSFLPFMFPDRMEQSRVEWHSEAIRVIPRDSADSQLFEAEFRRVTQSKEPVILEFPDGERVPLADAISNALGALPIPRMAPDVKSLRKDFELLPWTVGAVLDFSQQRMPVERITIQAVAEEIAIPVTNFYGEYRSEAGRVDHFVATSANSEGLGLTVEAKRGEDRFRINVPYEFFNENARKSVDPERGATIEVFTGKDGTPTIRRLD